MEAWGKCNCCGAQTHVSLGAQFSFGTTTCPACGKNRVRLEIGDAKPDWWDDSAQNAEPRELQERSDR